MKILKRGILSQSVAEGKNVCVLTGDGQYHIAGASIYPLYSDWSPMFYYKNKMNQNIEVWTSGEFPSIDPINIDDFPVAENTFNIYENTPPETLVGTADITGVNNPIFAISDDYSDGEGLAYSISDILSSDDLASAGKLRFLNLYTESIRIEIAYGGDLYNEDIVEGAWGSDVLVDCPNLPTVEHSFKIYRDNGGLWPIIYSTGIRSQAPNGEVGIIKRKISSDFEPFNQFLQQSPIYLGQWV